MSTPVLTEPATATLTTGASGQQEASVHGSGLHQLGIYTPNGLGKQIYLNVCNNSTINKA